ncbi:hypothetical protein HYO65_gp304 [Tenacibaculum phage PTm1]|uniref:Uncharacterized protein n=2 Tax=Shirahamavirus PTm1 TaxID=2846435 RepID=A0A5S9HXF8_9CAUD|nr:hypothetical protein HYO65_gp304 [Tenacibaculum phage PTm1]BBI90696.1 hypothetical protein [Tenacibaculum phage PTm1]BBI91002.1 hypothetical protein [Tenacibaculum phage PTm5]
MKKFDIKVLVVFIACLVSLAFMNHDAEPINRYQKQVVKEVVKPVPADLVDICPK